MSVSSPRLARGVGEEICEGLLCLLRADFFALAPELKRCCTACLYHHCPEWHNNSRFVVAVDNRSIMKLALLLSALAAASAKVAPLQLRKTKGLQAAGGAKTKGGYGQWAKDNAMANGVVIGAFKTAAADLIAQASDSESELDLKRNFLFFVFGGAYLGAFQYWYQVNIFKKIFTATGRFTSQSFEKKLKDTEGLVQLAMQIVLNLTILSAPRRPWTLDATSLLLVCVGGDARLTFHHTQAASTCRPSTSSSRSFLGTPIYCRPSGRRGPRTPRTSRPTCRRSSSAGARPTSCASRCRSTCASPSATSSASAGRSTSPWRRAKSESGGRLGVTLTYRSVAGVAHGSFTNQKRQRSKLAVHLRAR